MGVGLGGGVFSFYFEKYGYLLLGVGGVGGGSYGSKGGDGMGKMYSKIGLVGVVYGDFVLVILEGGFGGGGGVGCD